MTSTAPGITAAGHGTDRTLLLDDRDGSYSLTPAFLYLEDPSGAMTLAEAIAAAEAGDFAAPPEGKSSFGYTGSAYWVRFTAANRTADQASWILRINYSWFRSVQLYAPAAGAGSIASADATGGPEAGYTMRETGYRMPISTRDIKARQFLFDLYIPPKESETYYLRFTTTDLMILDLTLSSSRAYLAEDHENQLWYGIFFGILLVMVLYNLVLFTFLKEKSYLYFSLFIFFAVVHLLQESCLFYEYLHALPAWLKFERYFIYQSAMVFFGILFTVSFLDIRRSMPIIYRICVFLGILCVVTIPMNILLTDSILEAFSTALWISATSVSIAAAVIAMVRKFGSALFFAVGWGPFIIGTLLAALFTSDSVLMSPRDFVDRYGQLAGISLSALLFSAALADRYRGIRREKEITAEVNLRQKEFFVNLAHETKTPLTLIRNYLDEYISAHGTTHELAVIRGNIDKLLQDMVNFFDLQRLSLGKGISGEPVVVDLSAYLLEKREIASETARIRGLSLTGDIEPGIHVHADPLALERIVNNLLENAFKYNPPGGHVSLALAAAGKNVRLTVTDDGPGIPEDKLETIFVPYYQVSGKKKNIQGLGLGLVIARGAAREMGGDIRAANNSGGGCAFVVTLPAHQMAQGERVREISRSEMAPVSGLAARIPAASGISAAHSGETGAETLRQPLSASSGIGTGAEIRSVLVVEDNRDLLELLRLKLGRSFLVHAAANGIEALRVLESMAPPDAIVSDLMMDGMDGMELFETLREDRRFDAIPFLFVTARSDEGERAASLEKGVVDFIYKPFSMDELQSKIEALLRYGEARRKIAEREKASSLGMALGGIAHEIFNPLSGIIAPLSALKKIFFTADRPPDFEMKAEKHFRFIDENILRIENAVTVMKTLAYDRQLDKVPLPIEEIVSRAADAAGLSEDGPVRLVTRIEKGTEILGDREGAYQVMRNLLVNALDAIPAEGTITIVTENRDGNVVLTVSDTGKGIGRGDLDLIFEPFYTTKEGKRGMGMGLFIVRQLCLKMSWNISVESTEGAGTVFTLSQKRTYS